MQKGLLVGCLIGLLSACGGGGSGSGDPGPIATGALTPTGITGSGETGGAGTPGAGTSGAGTSGTGATGTGVVGSGTVTTPTSTALTALPVQRANAQTTGDQMLASVGALTDGGHAAVWRAQDGTFFLRQFAADGQARGAELALPLAVRDALPPGITDATAAVLTDGGAVVAYALQRDATDPLQPAVRVRAGVYFQRFNASGEAVGGETAVVERIYEPNYRSPSFAMVQAVALEGGGFVVGWANIAPSSVTVRFTLYNRRYAASGQADEPVVLGTSATPGDASYRLLADRNGGWTASIFQQDEQYQDAHSLQHFAPAPGLRVSNVADGAMLLALAPDRFVHLGTDAQGDFAALLDASGRSLRRIAAPGPVLAARALADGSFVAAWDSGHGVRAQHFDAQALPLGEPFAIDTDGADPQFAAPTGGGLVSAWSSAPTGDFDVYLQRFTQP